MFELDPKDPTPLYAQLERAIRVAIATGRLKGLDKLPTVRQLAVDLRINANTVAKVYGELERAGVVETRRGVGTFVREVATRQEPDPDRERRLADLADKFVMETAMLGVSLDQAIAYLQARQEQGGSSDG